MDMTIGTNPPPASVTAPAPAMPEPGAERAPVLGAENLRITVTPEMPGEARPLPPGTCEAISKMIDRHFNALLAIARNMGVSKEKREANARRLKELNEKRRKLEDLRKDELAELIQLIGMLKTESEAERQLQGRDIWA